MSIQSNSNNIIDSGKNTSSEHTRALIMQTLNQRKTVPIVTNMPSSSTLIPSSSSSSTSLSNTPSTTSTVPSSSTTSTVLLG